MNDTIDLTPAFTEWQEGNISATEALRDLCADLAEMDAVAANLDNDRTQVRTAIGHIVATLDGQKASVSGYSMSFTNPSTAVSYDRKKLESIISRMTAAGDEFAIELAQARTESQRAGTLRITKEKVKE